MFNFTELPPLSLYIHTPWCVRKCPYCDFNSHQQPDEGLPETAYIDALIRDLEHATPQIWGRTINTVFIGGGTPSLISAEAYDRLFSAIRALVPMHHDAEITLEANPGTIEAARFKGFREVGINRLSIGVQSFDDEALKILGRIHSANEAKKAIETVRKAGFDNFNIDLMFGLPQQDKAKALLDIDTALSFAPTHLSYYQLTMEPNTYFANHPPALPDEDDIDDWLLLNQQRLADAGYQQYETSAYAQSGKQCRHNLNYWQFGDYLGIGAGAHSKITRADTQSIHRMVKHKHPQRYQETAGSDDCLLENTQVAIEDVGFEFMLNAMRLIEGVPTHLFQQYTGVPLSRFKSAFENAEQQGLLEHSIHRLKPTYQGQRFLNTLIDCFIP